MLLEERAEGRAALEVISRAWLKSSRERDILTAQDMAPQVEVSLEVEVAPSGDRFK